jgi:hypothetical protein
MWIFIYLETQCFKTFIAWGSQDCDLDCLQYVLKSAKAEHLLPPVLSFAAQPLA